MTRFYRPGTAVPKSTGPDVYGDDPRHLDLTRPGKGVSAALAAWNARHEALAAEYERSGMTPVEARREASKALRREGVVNPLEKTLRGYSAGGGGS